MAALFLKRYGGGSMCVNKCKHCSGVAARSTHGGKSVTQYKCDKLDLCVLTADDLKTLKRPGVAVCDGCELYEADTVDYLACSARGAATGETIECGCQVDKNIYQCSILGKCIKRLPPSWSPDCVGNLGVCRGCEFVR